MMLMMVFMAKNKEKSKPRKENVDKVFKKTSRG
jgi:hypothetical protein